MQIDHVRESSDDPQMVLDHGAASLVSFGLRRGADAADKPASDGVHRRIWTDQRRVHQRRRSEPDHRARLRDRNGGLDQEISLVNDDNTIVRLRMCGNCCLEILDDFRCILGVEFHEDARVLLRCDLHQNFADNSGKQCCIHRIALVDIDGISAANGVLLHQVMCPGIGAHAARMKEEAFLVSHRKSIPQRPR
ncbi:hypothetical protein D9M70_381550 [compost metagenome]